jgi:hypothetical protein
VGGEGGGGVGCRHRRDAGGAGGQRAWLLTTGIIMFLKVLPPRSFQVSRAFFYPRALSKFQVSGPSRQAVPNPGPAVSGHIFTEVRGTAVHHIAPQIAIGHGFAADRVPSESVQSRQNDSCLDSVTVLFCFALTGWVARCWRPLAGAIHCCRLKPIDFMITTTRDCRRSDWVPMSQN